MKNLLLIILTALISTTAQAQMISITGGNLRLHGTNKGFTEIEAMQSITKNIATHISYTNVLGGYDITMIGGRYGLINNKVGLMLSACYMVKHDVMPMIGMDIKPFKNNNLSVTYNVSTDRKLSTVGVKFPLFDNHNKH